MILPSVKLDPRKAMRFVLLGQIALAALLITTDVLSDLPGMLRSKTELPVTPVAPGDQRREYRTDRILPELVQTDGPLDLPVPSEFPNQLTFTEAEVTGWGDVLLLSGSIEDGDARRFANYLDGMRELPDLVALHSPGGLVHEALEIGRAVRAAELDTAVMSGAFCLSSCPYILAGGEERTVSLSGIVGMHQHYYEQPRYLPVAFAVEGIQFGQGETMEYLVEMGIDPSLMIYSLKTPPEQIYALVEDELSATRMATETIE